MGSDLPACPERVGVVVGLAAEARIVRRLGWRAAVGCSTSAGAEVGGQGLIKEGARALISFGLAGGLSPVLRPGSVIVPSAVITGDGRYATDPALSQMLGGATSEVVFGSTAIASGVAEKRLLYQETGAAAVDLESGAVARVALRNGIPFAVLRAICDPAERALPRAALTALNRRGAIGIWRVLAAIALDPGQLRGLLTLAADAAKARRALVVRVRQIAADLG